MGLRTKTFIISAIIFTITTLQDQVHCKLGSSNSTVVKDANITLKIGTENSTIIITTETAITTEKPKGDGVHPGTINETSNSAKAADGSVSFLSRIGLQVAFGIVFGAGILATAATIYCLINGIGTFFFGIFYLLLKATGVIRRVPVGDSEEPEYEKHAMEAMEATNIPDEV